MYHEGLRLGHKAHSCDVTLQAVANPPQYALSIKHSIAFLSYHDQPCNHLPTGNIRLKNTSPSGFLGLKAGSKQVE
jgi:hypothetical protein